MLNCKENENSFWFDCHSHDIIGTCVGKMATSGNSFEDSPNIGTQNGVDLVKSLYPMVNEEETPLPRSWSSKDKFNFIGLSQNNLRVHYKGKQLCSLFWCLEIKILRSSLVLYLYCLKLFKLTLNNQY